MTPIRWRKNYTELANEFFAQRKTLQKFDNILTYDAPKFEVGKRYPPEETKGIISIKQTGNNVKR
jgi:hypothetical protein